MQAGGQLPLATFKRSHAAHDDGVQGAQACLLCSAPAALTIDQHEDIIVTEVLQNDRRDLTMVEQG